MSEPPKRTGFICFGVVPNGTRLEQLNGRVFCIYPSGEIATPVYDATTGKGHLAPVDLTVDERAAIGALRFTEFG